MIKKVIQIGLITTVILMLSSCDVYNRNDGRRVFGATSMNNSNPYFVAILDEMREQIEAHGDTLIVVDGAQSQEKQLNGVENLIVQNIDGMFINPVEAVGVEPALDALNAAGIPIINYDSKVAAQDKVITYVGSDNRNAGFVCGLDLVKKKPEGGDVIIISFKTADAVVNRVNGFLDAIEGHGFNIVGESDAVGDQTKAMNATTDLLQANPNVVAVFAATDPTAKGALSAVESSGLKDILIYGVDGSPDIKAEVAKEGSPVEGTGAQSPLTTAKKSVELMYAYLDGEELEDEYPVPTFLINSDNIDEYDIHGWQ